MRSNRKKSLYPLQLIVRPSLGKEQARGQTPFLMRNTCKQGQLTGYAQEAEHGRMSTTVEFTTPRRSTRIFRKLKVQAQGRGHNGKKFRETCETVVVSAHGGLLMLRHEVDNGEVLVITNPETQEEIEGRIVYLGDLCERGQRVAVEFLTPAPHFWGLEFAETATNGNDPARVH